MPTLSAQAPDGATLNVDVPPGTDPSKYGDMVDDAMSHYTSTFQSPVESGARGALRNFPLAQQAVATAAPVLNSIGLSKEPTYGAELQHLTDAAEQGKAENPKSYDTGAVAGTLVPLAIPGIGEAMGASGPLLDAAAGSGVVGGGLNAVAQGLSDTDLTKLKGQDFVNAGENALMGGALGALGNKFGASPTEEQLANKSAQGAGSIGNYSPSELISLPKQYAKELEANGLPSDIKGVQQLLGNNLNQELATTGQPIGALDSVKTVLDKSQNALDLLGQKQADLIKSIDSVPAAKGQAEAMAHDALNNFQNDARKWALPGQNKVPFQDLEARPGFRPELAQAKRWSAELGILRDDPSFGAAQELKEEISHKIRNFAKAATPGQSQEPLMMARTSIRNAMTEAAPPDLSDLLQREAKLHSIIQPIQRKASSLLANDGRSSMMSYYTSPWALAAYGAGHLVGGFIPGMLAGVTTATGMQRYGPQITTALNNPSNLINKIPNMTEAARLALTNYLASKNK